MRNLLVLPKAGRPNPSYIQSTLLGSAVPRAVRELETHFGEQPDDWKPMVSVGAGAAQIRVRDRAGAFRVIFVAKFEEAVYVLHCFQKKTRQTLKANIETAKTRYEAILAARRHR